MLHDVNRVAQIESAFKVRFDPDMVSSWQLVDDLHGNHRLGPPLAALRGNFTVATSVLVPEPRGGLDESSVDIWFNAHPDRTYLVQLRVRTGVRYVSVVRRDAAGETVLVDDIVAYDFDRWLAVEIRVHDARIDVAIDGRPVATGYDLDPLDGGAIGLGARGTTPGFGAVEIADDGPRAAPAPASATTPADEPAAEVDQPAGEATVVGSIGNDRYRVELASVGSTYRAELIAGADRWPAGRWTVLYGDSGTRRDPHASLARLPVTFTGFEAVDQYAARLRAEHELFELTLTWRLDRTHPRVEIALTPRADGRFVVAYRAFTAVPEDRVDEVLCGPMQHARMVRGPESIGRAELFAPFCLMQSDDRTVGLFAPADELPFEYETARGDDGQPFGMSLRNPDGEVQPILYAPQYGDRAAMRAGEPYRFEVGLYAARTDLFEAYRELLRGEYEYTAYRRNVFGASLTDTVHNLIDLLKTGPDAGDEVDYRASPSGWWSRAKGFIDIENDQAVRATTTSVLLGAYQLTGDDELYETRALPTIQFHLSRNAYGWTPREGYGVYGDTTKNRICATPFGATALAPLAALGRGRLPVAGALALSALDREDYWLKRTPISGSLAAYRLTRDPARLAQAEAAAERYLAEELDEAYTGSVDPHDFTIFWFKAWIELLELYEETGRRRYLDAAYREAKRFVGAVFVRPIPKGTEPQGTVTVPERPLFIDRQIDLKGWWDPADLFRYPRDDVPDEEVPAWQVATTGLSIEALKTYRFNGFTLNPGWAPFLLRLAGHTGDDLLRDIAHNAIVGRYTNYPGYYYRQLSVNHARPEFPYTGPFGNTTIYYHHAPAQLGMTIDYLFAEHQTRSGNEIAFPAEFEQNYVWFAYRVYGHAPGRFHGYEGVWPWLAKGLLRLDNHQINWIAGEDGERLFISLTNASGEAQRVEATIDPVLVPLRPDRSYPVTVIRDGLPTQRAELTGHRLSTMVSGHGITALIVDGVGPLRVRGPSVSAGPSSYHFDDDGPVGSVRGMLLPKPDGSRYHAYVQAASREPAALHYSVDGGATYQRLGRPAYPYEWTVPVDDLGAAFSYYVQVGERRSATVSLHLEAWC